MKQVAKLGLILALICAVSGFGLSAVYAKTKPIIDKRAEEDLLNAAKDVVPGASSIEVEEQDGVSYYLGKDGSEVVGAAMQIQAQGYGANPIQMMVGVNADAEITKIKIVSMGETPGIGTRIKDEAFLSNFVGTDSPQGVDGIAGATVSSGAVKGGAAKALSFLAGIIAPGGGLHIDIALVPDGTYEGVGEGLFGPIKVAVTVESGKITEIKVLSHEESDGIADPAFKGVPKSIIETQNLDVDTVAGATFTSEGIIDAVKDALKEFASEPGTLDISKLEGGTYKGTGEGLFGPIEVAVTVESGKITEIKVLSHGESDGIADPAILKTPKDIINAQSLDVDAVSGATFTSAGIIEAVKNALQGAR